jgi:hypothetical protein
MVTVVVYGRFLKITLRPSEAASLGAASSDMDVFFRDVVTSLTAALYFSTMAVILIDSGRNKGVFRFYDDNQ